MIQRTLPCTGSYIDVPSVTAKHEKDRRAVDMCDGAESNVTGLDRNKIVTVWNVLPYRSCEFIANILQSGPHGETNYADRTQALAEYISGVNLYRCRLRFGDDQGVRKQCSIQEDSKNCAYHCRYFWMRNPARASAICPPTLSSMVITNV